MLNNPNIPPYLVAPRETFDEMWRDGSRRYWLLSVIDPSGFRKTQFLRLLLRTRCAKSPHAIFSLAVYVNNINGLLSAIVESPSMRSCIPGPDFTTYKNDNENAFIDLNRRSFSVVKNDMTNSLVRDSDIQMQVGVEADATKLAESMDRISKFHTEMRILDSWLATIKTLSREQRVVFLFDDYDVFERDVYQLYKNFFWTVMERAANMLPNLCVVVGSERKLELPKGWQSWGGATATKIEDFP